MDTIYQDALDGTLASDNTGPSFQLEFSNDTDAQIQLFGVRTDTGLYAVCTIDPGSSKLTKPWYAGRYFVIKCAATGAFMAAADAGSYQASGAVSIHSAMLSDPNDIGAIPKPNRAVVIPVSSPSVLVGCGALPETGNYVTREQYWRLLPESFSLAKGEVRTVSFTETAGMQQTSSSMDTVSSSVSASVSAGWGPVSASLSASLSSTSTRMQQVSISSESTRYNSDELDNRNGESSVIYYVWQLTDVFNIFNAAGELQSSIIMGQNPTIISGPWNPDDLPAPAIRPALDESERARALES